MNRQHQLAIQLKYDGREYKQIAREIKKQLNIVVRHQTIKDWFYKDGLLYNDYILYEEEQNKELRDTARRAVRKIFAQNAKRAAEAIVKVFDEAITSNQPGLIVKYADIILAHADIDMKKLGSGEEDGNKNVNINVTTYEQFVDQFRRLGGIVQERASGPVVEGVEIGEGKK